jgi:hypothetical protein
MVQCAFGFFARACTKVGPALVLLLYLPPAARGLVRGWPGKGPQQPSSRRSGGHRPVGATLPDQGEAGARGGGCPGSGCRTGADARTRADATSKVLLAFGASTCDHWAKACGLGCCGLSFFKACVLRSGQSMVCRPFLSAVLLSAARARVRVDRAGSFRVYCSARLRQLQAVLCTCVLGTAVSKPRASEQ